MGELGGSGMEVGHNYELHGPFIGGGSIDIPKMTPGGSGSEITVPLEDGTVIVSPEVSVLPRVAASEQSGDGQQKAAVADAAGASATRSAVQPAAEGGGSGSGPKERHSVPQVVVKPPTDTPGSEEMTPTPNAETSEQGLQPADIRPEDVTSDAAGEHAVEDDERTRAQWSHGQANRAIRQAEQSGLDVASLIPGGGSTLLMRMALPHLLEGKPLPEIASAIGVSRSAISRAQNTIAGYIRTACEENGYPEGLTPEMVTPPIITLREKPQDYAMAGVKERLRQLGIGLEEVAQEIDVSLSTLSRLLEGYTHPTPTLAKHIIGLGYSEEPEAAQAKIERYIDEYKRVQRVADEKRRSHDR
jgi:hypothetical protein